MKAETMIKRANSKRKDIQRYWKEIAAYEREYCSEEMPEHMKKEGRRWIEYYTGLINKTEKLIAEMLDTAAALTSEEDRKSKVKAMAEDMAKNGIGRTGYTVNGLRYNIEWNNGLTDRSRYCNAMYIEGKGLVFTSGTLETVAEYILNN